MAFFPRTEGFDGRDGRNPIISPKASPVLLRKGILRVPKVSWLLPFRKATTTLRSPTNLPSSNIVLVPAEEPVYLPLASTESQKIYLNPCVIESGGYDSAYDVLQEYDINLVTCPSEMISGASVSYMSRPEDASQYSELPHYSEVPSYENITISGHSSTEKPFVRFNEDANTKDNRNHRSKIVFTRSVSQLPPYCYLVTTTTASVPLTGISSSSSNMHVPASSSILLHDPHSDTYFSPSPSQMPTKEMKTGVHKSLSNEQKFKINYDNESSTSYENVNIDYIKRLTNEGYTHDAVIRALGITRNDLEMAYDILQEFATKTNT